MSSENPASQSARKERKFAVTCGGRLIGGWYSGGDVNHIYVKNETGAAQTVTVQIQLYDAQWQFQKQVDDGPSTWRRGEGRNEPDFQNSPLPPGQYFEKVYIYDANGNKIYVNECAWEFDVIRADEGARS
jgi:hypothetical protein